MDNKKRNKYTWIVSIILAFFIFVFVSYETNTIRDAYGDAAMGVGSSVIGSNDAFSAPRLFMLSSEGEAQMSSFIIITRKRKVIVVDGGWTYDAEKLIKTLKDNGVCKVDAWLLTHSDPDHSGALYEILKHNKHKENNIQIGTIYFSFPDSEWYQINEQDTYGFVEEFRDLLFFENTCQVRANQTFAYDDVYFKTLNQITTPPFPVVNDNSIVYKVSVYVGKEKKKNNGKFYLVDKDVSILFLGDIGQSAEHLLDPLHLSSDYVQMSHHGQAGASQKLYEVIAPSVCLWPSPIWLWTNREGTGSLTTLETRKWIEEIGAKNYVSGFGDVEINLLTNKVKQDMQ